MDSITKTKERLIEDVMQGLAQKQAIFNNYQRRPRIPSTNSIQTVTRFIGKRLQLDEDTLIFKGENRYGPENWSLDTQYKKIIDYCVQQKGQTMELIILKTLLFGILLALLVYLIKKRKIHITLLHNIFFAKEMFYVFYGFLFANVLLIFLRFFATLVLMITIFTESSPILSVSTYQILTHLTTIKPKTSVTQTSDYKEIYQQTSTIKLKNSFIDFKITSPRPNALGHPFFTNTLIETKGNNVNIQELKQYLKNQSTWNQQTLFAQLIVDNGQTLQENSILQQPIYHYASDDLKKRPSNQLRYSLKSIEVANGTYTQTIDSITRKKSVKLVRLTFTVDLASGVKQQEELKTILD